MSEPTKITEREKTMILVGLGLVCVGTAFMVAFDWRLAAWLIFTSLGTFILVCVEKGAGKK